MRAITTNNGLLYPLKCQFHTTKILFLFWLFNFKIYRTSILSFHIKSIQKEKQKKVVEIKGSKIKAILKLRLIGGANNMDISHWWKQWS